MYKKALLLLLLPGCLLLTRLPFYQCGDGLIEKSNNPQKDEECDDGNNNSGDGCSAACVFERCVGVTSCEGDVLLCQQDEATFEVDCALKERVCNVELGECSLCGNGNLDADEECEDGNTQSGDGCNAACQSEAVCGDTLLGLAEVCDDGNSIAGDGCRADCRGVELCGDALLDPIEGEACDDGNIVGGDGCRADCLGVEACGDSLVDALAAEQCDDGNASGLDDCDACALTSCGDGIVQSSSSRGELCDDANQINGDGCDASCQLEPDANCGNNVTEAPEACDDGNNISGDGCNANCSASEECGDGISQAGLGEQCDDANVTNGDGCNAQCNVERCGDGLVNNAGAEECDDANVTPGDGCNATCQSEFCGDGLVNNAGAEQCDDGNQIDDDSCTNQCQPNSQCGNGVLNAGEQCDDNNTNFNDGCNELCQLEADIFVNCASASLGNGTLASPFNSLTTAIQSADSLDRIMLLPQAAQICNGPFNINKSLAIYGLARLVYPLPTQLPLLTDNNETVIVSGANLKVSLSGLKIASTGGVDDVVSLLDASGAALALVGVEIFGGNNNTGVLCDSSGIASAKILIDRSLLRNLDVGVEADQICALLMTNSVMDAVGEEVLLSGAASTSAFIRNLFRDNNITLECTAFPISTIDSSVNVGAANNLFCANQNSCANPNLTTGAEGGVFAPFHLASNAPCFNNATVSPTLPFDPIAIFSGLPVPFSLEVLRHDVKGEPRVVTPDKGIFEEPL